MYLWSDISMGERLLFWEKQFVEYNGLGYPLIRSAVGFHKGQFLGPTFISYINYLNNASKLESLVFADEKVLKTMFYLSVC